MLCPLSEIVAIGKEIPQKFPHTYVTQVPKAIIQPKAITVKEITYNKEISSKGEEEESNKQSVNGKKSENSKKTAGGKRSVQEKVVGGESKKKKVDYLSDSSGEYITDKNQSIQQFVDFINKDSKEGIEEEINVEKKVDAEESKEKFVIDGGESEEEAENLGTSPTRTDRDNYAIIKRLNEQKKKNSISKSQDSDSDSLIIDKGVIITSKKKEGFTNLFNRIKQ